MDLLGAAFDTQVSLDGFDPGIQGPQCMPPISFLYPVRAGFFAALLLLQSGCSPRTPPTPSEQTTDFNRIICGSPAVTEWVFALGAGHQVVGVNDYTSFPPEALERPRIGGWINPNRERLLMLRPDLILTQGEHEALHAFATQYDIRFESLALDTLEDVFQGIQTLAARLNVSEQGETLMEQLRSDLSDITRRIARQPPQRVLLIFNREAGSLTGLTTVGPGSFLGDLLSLAGGINLFEDTLGAYPQISKESILMRKPDVILELRPGMAPDDMESLRQDWNALRGIPAVEQNRVHFLTDDFLLIPGSRIAETARKLARTIHPECFE